ncbi:Shedu immune nuclease family protein [Ferruginibacter sp. SUN002]|uniref:Shedu immune nuclease family protein n=1 Tax=Ferruginibacter sp. SUN002 TaxID=2937789 RepID=UPI003D363B4C
MATTRTAKPKTLVIDKKAKTIIYNIDKDSAQHKVFQSIKIVGFTELPKGFYKKGAGLDAPAGTFLVNSLRDTINIKFQFEINKDQPTSIKKIGRGFKVVLKYSDYLQIQEGLKDIRKEKNDVLRNFVTYKLGTLLTEYYEKPTKPFDDTNNYQEDRISKIIHVNPNLIDTLSKNDITSIAELYHQLLTKNKLSSKPQDLKVIGKTKDQNEKLYLQKVIEKFEEDITKKTLSESHWQTFLSQFILLFNTSYVKVLEKMSVSLAGKYPDFMLIDIYNFIDIYEIKKPYTELLEYDDSRNNYYWHKEVSKAISQTENYIHQLTKNATSFKDDLKEKGIEIKVVRPRGYIIVGHSNQLAEEKKQNDFRLLANSHKNIEIILYDELLTNLKNLVKRLE